MKKYYLFNEYCCKEIFGTDLADALTHCGDIMQPGSVQDHIYTPGSAIEVAKVLGYDDTTNSTRGNKKYISAVVELVDGTRRSIDAVECGEIKEVA